MHAVSYPRSSLLKGARPRAGPLAEGPGWVWPINNGSYDNEKWLQWLQTMTPNSHHHGSGGCITNAKMRAFTAAVSQTALWATVLPKMIKNYVLILLALSESVDTKKPASVHRIHNLLEKISCPHTCHLVIIFFYLVPITMSATLAEYKGRERQMQTTLGHRCLPG